MYDAVIVLGAGINDISVGRIKKGIEVVKSGLARILVFVGGSDDGALAASLSRTHGLNDSQIYIDTNSRNTVDNAYYAKKILERLNMKKVALVTSKFHMERSLAIFEWVLGDEFLIVPVPVEDEPDREVVEKEECLKKLIPLMKSFFAKGDAEGIKKAIDSLYVILRSLLQEGD
ncbi:MAG: YdcF family protein [Zestosphaera sp.]